MGKKPESRGMRGFGLFFRPNRQAKRGQAMGFDVKEETAGRLRAFTLKRKSPCAIAERKRKRPG